MEQIRVSRGLEICVNDNEETINANVDNSLWVDSFIKWLEKAERLSQESVKADRGMDGTIEVMTELIADMNNLFGEGASDKVFGEGVLPVPLNLVEFVNQLVPIIATNANNRQKKILDKYSKTRKGGRK